MQLNEEAKRRFLHERQYSPDTAIDERRPEYQVHGKTLGCSKQGAHAKVACANEKRYTSLDGYDFEARNKIVENLTVCINPRDMGDRKSLSMDFKPASVSTKLATESGASDEIQIGIRTPSVTLQKHGVESNAPSSYSTLIAYVPFGGGVQSFSFADASILSVVSMFVGAVGMLSPCVWVSIERSLCVTSDETL